MHDTANVDSCEAAEEQQECGSANRLMFEHRNPRRQGVHEHVGDGSVGQRTAADRVHRPGKEAGVRTEDFGDVGGHAA